MNLYQADYGDGITSDVRFQHESDAHALAWARRLLIKPGMKLTLWKVTDLRGSDAIDAPGLTPWKPDRWVNFIGAVQ